MIHLTGRSKRARPCSPPESGAVSQRLRYTHCFLIAQNIIHLAVSQWVDASLIMNTMNATVQDRENSNHESVGGKLLQSVSDGCVSVQARRSPSTVSAHVDHVIIIDIVNGKQVKSSKSGRAFLIDCRHCGGYCVIVTGGRQEGR